MLANVPTPAVIKPVCNCSDVADCCAAHAAAAGPVGSDNAAANDTYTPSPRPNDTLSYNPDVALSCIISDSMPGLNPNASLRVFKSDANVIYSVYSGNNWFPPGNVMPVSPPLMLRPEP